MIRGTTVADQIIVRITNNTGGNADIILFYSEVDGQIWNGTCSLADGDTSNPILTVSVPDTFEYWAISVLVKDGPNAGYYISQDGGWYQLALHQGSFIFAVDTTALTFSGGYQLALQLAAPRPDPSAPAISHVFVVMLENRSFDHMLAFSGIPGITAATTADSNTYMIMDAAGSAEGSAARRVGALGPQTCYVQVGRPGPMPTDPGHEFLDVVMQLCGEFASFDPANGYPQIDNSGFLASYATSTTEYPYHPPTTDAGLDEIMTCFASPCDLPILTTLAQNFALWTIGSRRCPGRPGRTASSSMRRRRPDSTTARRTAT